MVDLESRFDALWNQAQDFELPEYQPPKCVFAQRFSDWTSDLCANVAQNPSIIFVNQAKILLLDKYFEWRSFVPKSHRNHLGANGHTCLFQILVEAYERLKVVELSLTPPLLFLPTLSSPPPQIAGIFIGETEDKGHA